MKKIAVINDLSGMGKCSLTAAISVISSMGVQVCPFPTAILSNQTGYPSYYCDDYTPHMDAMMEEWEKRRILLDGIYTGFLAGEAQVDKILDFFGRFRKEHTHVLVDPVMGDQGSVYAIYTPSLLEKIRKMVVHADVITPNLTEALLLLYGEKEMKEKWRCLNSLEGEEYLTSIRAIGRSLQEGYSIPSVVITGVDYRERNGASYGPEEIGNLVLEGRERQWFFSLKQGGSYSGTGDLFASVLSAGLVKGISMNRCVGKAVSFLSKAIADSVQEGTDRNDGVCFETYLHELWEEDR